MDDEKLIHQLRHRRQNNVTNGTNVRNEEHLHVMGLQLKLTAYAIRRGPDVMEIKAMPSNIIFTNRILEERSWQKCSQSNEYCEAES